MEMVFLNDQLSSPLQHCSGRDCCTCTNDSQYFDAGGLASHLDKLWVKFLSSLAVTETELSRQVVSEQHVEPLGTVCKESATATVAR